MKIVTNWKKVWGELDDNLWKIEGQFEKDMRKKYGPHEGIGSYYMSSEDYWQYQKKFIQRFVKKHSTIK